MPTRQCRDEPPPTLPSPDPQVPDPRAPDAPISPAASREPVLLGEVLFHTLAELARRTPDPVPALPAQRTGPHP
ncbi:hypothetical protein [Kitasatospora aureofaciens]|uniref:hypothetical protein n=1 Tax=Kitasatospora aureofaciens TaxID=1894 RepID=UPI000524F1DC|nr:hypothetical protein [Kitasatospora aureofaciens]HJD80019.1 hypothetical protein [Kitasatospora aureofaciens]